MAVENSRPYRQNNNTFTLFPAEGKDHPTQPDFHGKASLPGRSFVLIGYSRETRDGRPYIAGEIIEDDER